MAVNPKVFLALLGVLVLGACGGFTVNFGVGAAAYYTK
jgi:hypothetical protein